MTPVIVCMTLVRMVRDEILNMRLPADVKNALKRAAEDDFGRSLSAMGVKLITEALTAQGYLPKNQPPAQASAKARARHGKRV